MAESDSTNDVEIGSIQLNHEKFAHRDPVYHETSAILDHHNHHQIRGIAVFQNFFHNTFLNQFGLIFNSTPGGSGMELTFAAKRRLRQLRKDPVIKGRPSPQLRRKKRSAH